MDSRNLLDQVGGLNLRLGRGRRHFGWTIAVDGDLLVGGRTVLLGRRAAPEPVALRLVDLAAVPVPVVHVAEAEGDRRPYHEGELPFRKRAAAGHAARAGHSYGRESLTARGQSRRDTRHHEDRDAEIKLRRSRFSLTDVRHEAARARGNAWSRRRSCGCVHSPDSILFASRGILSGRPRHRRVSRYTAVA